MRLPFRIMNVFAVEGERLSGNPLCVFEDGSGLSDEQMQALARQMNLSETTFLLPPTAATATCRVRIFTPSFELPFAGHPTLGSAAVAHGMAPAGATPSVVLEMAAGAVPVVQNGASWTLRTAQPATHRAVEADRKTLCAMLGVPEQALGGTPLWVNTGSEQLVVPLVDATAVQQVRPDAALLGVHGFSELRGASMVYVWAPEATDAESDRLVARFFFLANGRLVEDPATGSACANLGGWYLAQRAALPLRRTISQGRAVHRPSRLELSVDLDGGIFVSGVVLELGRGVLELAPVLQPERLSTPLTVPHSAAPDTL
jgi:trans-2,3-dihydro-3-hydroxyanthranilate isomerase